MKPTSDIKAGDIIGFSGRYWHSVLINICTFGLPFWSLSHVGIVARARDGRLLLFESTDDSTMPCEIAGKTVVGVQAHKLEDILKSYNGRVWHYPLYRPLYRHEDRRLTGFLMNLIGRPYDNSGAIRAGGLLFARVMSLLHDEDFGMLFCSELTAAPYSHIGLFSTTNASQWSPNKLMRALRRRNIVYKPRRLK